MRTSRGGRGKCKLRKTKKKKKNKIKYFARAREKAIFQIRPSKRFGFVIIRLLICFGQGGGEIYEKKKKTVSVSSQRDLTKTRGVNNNNNNFAAGNTRSAATET